MPVSDGTNTWSGRSTKRGDVVEAAERLFLGNGYAGTSMEAVAREAGVIKQTVYRYYASKEALFGAVMTGICARIFPEDAPDLTDDEDIRTTLADFARKFIVLHRDPDTVSLFRVVMAEAHRFPELAQAFMGIGPDRFRGSLATYLRRRAADGFMEVPNPEAAATYFLGMLLTPFHTGLCLGIRATPRKRETEAIIDEVLDIFLCAFPIRDAEKNS